MSNGPLAQFLFTGTIRSIPFVHFFQDMISNLTYIGVLQMNVRLDSMNLTRRNSMSRQTLLELGTLIVLLAAITVPIVAAEDKQVALDKDPHLMGWWKFDETTGNIASDSSRHKRNATLDDELTFEKASVDGKVGKAVKLARGEAIDVKGYKGVTGTGPRTVAVWIKTKERRGDIVVWGEHDSGKQFCFRHIRGRIGMTPFGGYYYMKEYTDDDKWHHIAVVVKEAELPNLYDDIVLYLNGEVAELDDIGLLGLLPVETAEKDDVRIGDGYEGLLDDLRIYSRALSINEIKAIYQGKSDKPLEKE